MTDLPGAIERRVANYKPTKPAVRDALVDGDLDRVRAAVRKAKPSAPGEASRLLSHAARHLAFVRAELPDTPANRLFAADAVDVSIKAAEAVEKNPSPFKTDLRRLSRAAAVSRLASPRRQVIAGVDPQAPYSAEEQSSLLGITGGMERDEAASLGAGIGLAIGAGLIGSAADALRADSTVEVAGHLLVWSQMIGGWVPVRQAWAAEVRAGLAAAGERPVTRMYSLDGRQRLDRRLARATGRPDLSSHRMRNTWLAESLVDGVPVDVLTAASATLPSGLLRHLPAAPPACPPCWRRSLHGDVPPPPASLIAAFSDVATRGASVAVRNVPGPDLADFAPLDQGARRVWAAGLGEAITARVWEVTDDEGRARDLLCAASALLTWSVANPTIPNTLAALLRESTIERWAAASEGGVPDATRATYKSRLRFLAGLAAATGQASREVALPYEASEAARLLDARDDLTADDRAIFDAVWHIGLGAGRRADHVTAGAVREADGIVEIEVDHTWLVVHRDHASDVVALAGRKASGLRWFSRARVVSVRRKVTASSGVALDPRRLRAGWLCTHLAAGVPLPALVHAAGAKVASIDELCARLPTRSAAERLAWMVHADQTHGCPHGGTCN